MADKSKTIKNATDKELNDLIVRLRRENDVQDLIARLRRNSIDGFMSYDQQQGVSTEEPIDSLYHTGVLGMKWGRRRNRGTQARSNKKSVVDNAQNSEDHEKKLHLKGKKLNAMSNAELKSLNERLQMEKSYKDLTKNEISPGRKWVTEIISGSAKQVATTYVAKYMGKGIEALIKKSAKKAAKVAI